MRKSGILLHITSLPTPHGIGTLGKDAYRFVDFLRAAGQSCWQILPLGPTGYGDSPYQTDSSFAGNPYLIDLDLLAEEGLLTGEEIAAASMGDDPHAVDFAALYAARWPLLRQAFRRGWSRDREAAEAFYRENESWLRPYALFFAAKRRFGMRPWTEWEEGLRSFPAGSDLLRWEDELREDRELCIFLQYHFYRQWDALRAYVRDSGIEIIGDVPIYVPMDSADVWSERELFELDDQCRPTEVAGVPPDYFNEDGQLWGNPLYDWKEMERRGFDWWIRRLKAAGRLYDVVRIDHFRGLESFWAVPYGDRTARQGRWRPGPGKAFISAVRTALPELKLIAEDLGYLTPEVRELREFSGFPGMKILQFAFDPSGDSEYLPHRIGPNSVCYCGTHDNTPLGQWLAETDEKTLAFAREYLGLNEEEGYRYGLLRAGMGCASDLFVSQMQDWLDLGTAGRMNEPGILGCGNWCWRMDAGAAGEELAKKIARMTKLYGRGGPASK
ncbi:MAG: 4-alpha-glucanotransferase [Oscillospiraceae bacterium]|nr:4-alpha-glucanotransferase [Oscillospiraceae bacterium]